MNEWLKVLGALASLATIVIPVIARIRTRNPANRKYWEQEAQERLGSDGGWPKDARLRKRAELALAYLDADEAIRRTGLPGPATSWIIGTFCYLAVVVFGVQAGRISLQRNELHEKIAKAKSSQDIDSLQDKLAEVDSPTVWIVLAIVTLALTVWAFIDAATYPQKRNELHRVLVSLMAIPGGASALEARPETFVKGWNDRKRKKRIKQSTKNIKDAGRVYDIWAKILLLDLSNPSTRVSIKVTYFDRG